MIFNTWTFALFALTILPVYWTLIPQARKPVFIIAAGCVFYSASLPLYLALIICLGATTYAAATVLLRTRNPGHRKLLLAASVALVVCVLALFKYFGFIGATINAVAAHNVLPVPHLIVPLAISFFTFEFVHVLVDVYLRKIEHVTLIDFVAFSMFFPTLVAGPIKRYQSFVPQLHAIEMPSNEVLGLSLYRVMIGLAKKFIIADSMTLLTQPIINPNGQPYGQIEYWIAILAYTAKIYFDFSGYSDIAIGLAALLGVAIPENFDRPYWSENIADFWRRWHISLSSWIRDYIFVPLGGSRKPPLISALNLLTAMAIAGLWHGAAWTFVCWGLWHGSGLAIHRLWSVQAAPKLRIRLLWSARFGRAVSIGATFSFVALGWVLFAAPSFENAFLTISRALGW